MARPKFVGYEVDKEYYLSNGRSRVRWVVKKVYKGNANKYYTTVSHHRTSQGAQKKYNALTKTMRKKK